MKMLSRTHSVELPRPIAKTYGHPLASPGIQGLQSMEDGSIFIFISISFISNASMKILVGPRMLGIGVLVVFLA